MKNTTLAAILSIAATMTASAQYGGGYSYSTTQESGWNPYASLSGGYLLDDEEPYYLLQLGVGNANDTRLYLQVGYAQKDETATELAYELFAVSVGTSSSHYFDSSNSIYFGGSVGIASMEVSASGLGSASDEMLYFDVTTGFRHDFSETLSGHVGVRYMYRGDFEYGGVSVSESGDDFGLELGFTVRF